MYTVTLQNDSSILHAFSKSFDAKLLDSSAPLLLFICCWEGMAFQQTSGGFCSFPSYPAARLRGRIVHINRDGTFGIQWRHELTSCSFQHQLPTDIWPIIYQKQVNLCKWNHSFCIHTWNFSRRMDLFLFHHQVWPWWDRSQRAWCEYQARFCLKRWGILTLAASHWNNFMMGGCRHFFGGYNPSYPIYSSYPIYGAISRSCNPMYKW